ncbi:MAG TPA: hypothetical protein PLE19_11240 [Planctomycetota bacterium]|nr:hypothetical protein [Planctomycetota bacterium]HRR78996.1 hypothetical protein [Planctomycetota bacterium]HRT93444.1 hypothetical protein [Planctomycetota bacterium]
MIRRQVLVVLIALLGPAPAFARNLLENPSFERDRNRDGLPDGWHRVFDEKLSGPFALVDDAQDGRRAVCLETEEWNFLRPQHIAQKVKLPRDAAYCRLAVHAKGRGLVSLTIVFLKDGQPLREQTIDMGFGKQQAPEEVKKDFALELGYTLYETLSEVPPGANGALVKLGNTAAALDRLNNWGRCFLDNASFVTGSRGELDTLSQTDEPARLELSITDALRNIAPYARIRSEPPSFDNRLLTDGDTKTAPEPYPGADRGIVYNILLPKPLPIRKLRLHLNGLADSYSIRGDADGDGVFEAPLLRTSGLQGLTGWKTHTLPGGALKALRLQAIAGTEPLWGFRQCHPFVTEIEVHVPPDAIPDAELKAWAVNQYQFPLAGGVPAIEAKPAELTLERPKASRFRKLVCADLWMWGIHYDKKTPKGTWTKEKVKENKGFQESAQVCKEMGVDTVFIDLTNSSCWDLMPWPSKVCNGTEDNILKCLIDALHDEGFKVVTQTLHNFTPFEPIKWHYPCEETSRYPGMRQFPSILYGGHVRDNWLTIYEEQVAAGADGVCLGSDEFYYRGHFLETLPADDAQRRDYEKRFGHPVPAKEADTLEYRQWVAHTEEGLTGLFTFWNTELKKRHPGLYTTTVFMQPVQRSNLYGEGVPFDLIGARSGIDEIGSDYMDPWGIRLLAAANGWRRTSQFFWGWQKAEEPALLLTARPLWMLMYGGASCNYWRFFQLKESGHWKSVQKGYAMATDLEALGVLDARPPRDIAVLSSRASWDWWQVRSFYGKLPWPEADRAIEAMRGWFADEWVNDRLLLRNGYTYDWYFADNPAHLERLHGYKLLILPFAYSLSDTAAAKVREAAGNGTRVVLFRTLGETDEWGVPRTVPALKDIADSGQAVVIPDDILEVAGDDTFMSKLLALIDTTLGEKAAFKLHRYGKRVDAALLAKGDWERFLFLINWEETPATVDLSVAVPDGGYTLMMRDDAAWHRVTLGGKDQLSPAMLRKFRRVLAPQKAEVYYLAPATSR